MESFDAIIFDMDGVLVDSEPLHEQAFREVFHVLGYGDNHGVDFPAYYGRSDRALWLDFIAQHRPPQPIENLVRLKHERFVNLLRARKPVFPGLEELLASLANQYGMAVASGSTHEVIDEVVAIRNLRRFFKALVSVTDVRHGKPAPDVFLRAAELLGHPPHRCCVIEDAAAGVEAAISAGMAVIAITTSLPAAALSRATKVIHKHAELAPLLLP